jgi:hypothetical protein
MKYYYYNGKKPGEIRGTYQECVADALAEGHQEWIIRGARRTKKTAKQIIGIREKVEPDAIEQTEAA